MDSKQYSLFMKQQTLVYDAFEKSRSKLLIEGLNKHQLSSKGVYTIYFKHSLSVCRKIEKMSETISTFLPVMTYSAPTVHTTIATYDGLKLNFIPDKEVLKRLCLGVKNASKIVVPSINYSNLMINQDTIILKGVSNKDFLETTNNIVNSMKEQDIELKMPWGAHITVARINAKIKDSKNVISLLNYIDSYDGAHFISRPTRIGVGYGLFSDDGFSLKLNEFDEYKFK